MPTVRVAGALMLVGAEYKPGDQAPSGYLAWHEWADVQHKAGLRQRQCCACGKWAYPQQIASDREFIYKTSRGKELRRLEPVCNACAKA